MKIIASSIKKFYVKKKITFLDIFMIKYSINFTVSLKVLQNVIESIHMHGIILSIRIP